MEAVALEPGGDLLAVESSTAAPAVECFLEEDGLGMSKPGILTYRSLSMSATRKALVRSTFLSASPSWAASVST